MTEFRKNIYEKVRHGRSLGESDRSALCSLINENDLIIDENKNLKAQIQYLEYQLEQYHKFDSFLAAYGFFESNIPKEEAKSVTYSASST